MHSKKGVELSINFLVTFIFGIILFAFGVIFATRLFQQAGDISRMSQEQLDKSVEELTCTKDQEVCLSASTKALQRGQDHVFGVNVVNTYKDATNFRIMVSNPKAFDREGKPIFDNLDPLLPDGNSETMLGILPTEKEFSLEPNLQEQTGILIQALSTNPKGRFIIDIFAEYHNTCTVTLHPFCIDENEDALCDDCTPGWEQHGAIQKIYVTIS
ncbi:hypothetical protein HYS48_03050 [Candidatus Woesearchaeota archaeon]|nr:hypothetical protein [Candidatus Woesearchaeota archaeon]